MSNNNNNIAPFAPEHNITDSPTRHPFDLNREISRPGVPDWITQGLLAPADYQKLLRKRKAAARKAKREAMEAAPAASPFIDLDGWNFIRVSDVRRLQLEPDETENVCGVRLWTDEKYPHLVIYGRAMAILQRFGLTAEAARFQGEYGEVVNLPPPISC